MGSRDGGLRYNVAMPDADLSMLWEEHTRHEFTTRDTEATLATMVEDAYVNHVPVMTGGVGKAALRGFYSRILSRVCRLIQDSPRSRARWAQTSLSMK